MTGTKAVGASTHVDTATGATVMHITARDDAGNWAQVAIATTDIYVVAVRVWSAAKFTDDNLLLEVAGAQLAHLY